MPRRPGAPRRLATAAATTALLVGSSAAAVLLSPAPRAAAETITLPASGNIQVVGNGNGHGHGMSQYGARGAAQAGLTAAQIVAFYYPGTTLTTISPVPTIRVQISGAESVTRVIHATSVKSGLTSISLTAANQYRLVPSGTGLQAQLLSGSTWKALTPTLGAQADFSASTGLVRLYLGDGTSTDYFGTVGAVRSGSGETTINRVGLDQYAQGVAPREMPASWSAAAVQAQAIAARTYGEFEREHAGSNPYDICDTSQCQVYGGSVHYDSGGNILWQDDSAAISGNAGKYLKYGTGAAFSQFSASDGGWTVDGGQPYLIAKADPYDNAASGDPYIHWTDAVPVSQIASSYGLARATQIQITQRDGNGEWGGRVVTANVIGTTSGGQSTSVATTGFELQDAMGLLTNWFAVVSALQPTLGGTIVHSTTTSADVFFHSSVSDHLVNETYVSGSGWKAAVDMGAPTNGLKWDPDAASWGSGHIDVFARDGTGILVNRSFSTATGWTGWRSNGVSILSSPAVVDPVVDECDVFYLGPNHTLWTLRWTKAAGWTQAAAVPGVANVNSGPDATSLVTSKNVVVAYRGTDGRFWTVTRSGSTWGAPAPVNPGRSLPQAAVGVDPAIDNSGGDKPNVYYTATNGLIYHASVTPATGVWSAWYSVPGGGTTSAPDAWTDLATHGDVVSGHNGVFGTASWSAATGWRTWMPLP